MDNPLEILRRAERVVLYDWPNRDVPDALALCLPPAGGAPRILDDAKRMSASTIWRQSGLDAAGQRDPQGCAPTPDSQEWRHKVEAAGLQYVEDAYIGDVVRRLTASP